MFAHFLVILVLFLMFAIGLFMLSAYLLDYTLFTSDYKKLSEKIIFLAISLICFLTPVYQIYSALKNAVLFTIFKDFVTVGIGIIIVAIIFLSILKIIQKDNKNFIQN